MATFKVTNIIKIENKTKQEFSFRPYRQNFIVVIGAGDILELRTSTPEQSLQYYKSVLPYADIELVDKFDKDTYTIDTTGFEHGTISGATEIASGGTAQLTIEADTGYELPSDVTVTGATKVSFIGGVLTIENPTDDVVITGSCVAEEWTISVNVTNGTSSGDQTILTDGTASVTIAPISGEYTLPESITVNGDSGTSGSTGVTWSYNATTGVVSLSNPTSNVSISAECQQEQPVPSLIAFEEGQRVMGIQIDPSAVSYGELDLYARGLENAMPIALTINGSPAAAIIVEASTPGEEIIGAIGNQMSLPGLGNPCYVHDPSVWFAHGVSEPGWYSEQWLDLSSGSASLVHIESKITMPLTQGYVDITSEMIQDTTYNGVVWGAELVSEFLPFRPGDVTYGIYFGSSAINGEQNELISEYLSMYRQAYDYGMMSATDPVIIFRCVSDSCLCVKYNPDEKCTYLAFVPSSMASAEYVDPHSVLYSELSLYGSMAGVDMGYNNIYDGSYGINSDTVDGLLYPDYSMNVFYPTEINGRAMGNIIQ